MQMSGLAVVACSGRARVQAGTVDIPIMAWGASANANAKLTPVMDFANATVGISGSPCELEYSATANILLVKGMKLWE